MTSGGIIIIIIIFTKDLPAIPHQFILEMCKLNHGSGSSSALQVIPPPPGPTCVYPPYRQDCSGNLSSFNFASSYKQSLFREMPS